MSAGPQKDVQTSARVRTRGTVVGKQAYLSKRALVATAKAFFSAEISPHPKPESQHLTNLTNLTISLRKPTVVGAPHMVRFTRCRKVPQRTRQVPL